MFHFFRATFLLSQATPLLSLILQDLDSFLNGLFTQSRDFESFVYPRNYLRAWRSAHIVEQRLVGLILEAR